MKLSDLLPCSEMPRSGFPENYSENWYGTDNAEDYRKRGGHPIYGETDITYRCNSRGYRCPEFDYRADIRIVSIGCSWTFGVGVPQEAIFHELFAERLRAELRTTVVNWNLGISGASNDYIARVLHLVIPKLDPDLVLILFPRSDRREYMAAHDRRISYIPTCQSADPVAKEIAAHLHALSSVYENLLNFFRNYKSIECLLSSRPWIFSLTDPNDANAVTCHLDRAHQAASHHWIDKARDNLHPGPEMHKSIYDFFWRKFEEVGGLANLTRGRRLQAGSRPSSVRVAEP